MARISFTFIKNMSIVVRIHHLFQWGSCIFRLDNFIHFLKNGLGYSALLSQSERLCKYNVDLLDQFTIFKNNSGYSIVIIHFSKMMLGIPFLCHHTHDMLLHRINMDLRNFQKNPGSNGAPFCTRSSAISEWPLSLAMYNGVVSFVMVFGSAPCSRRRLTVSISPASTAAIKGSKPSCALMLGLHPLFNRYLKHQLKMLKIYMMILKLHSGFKNSYFLYWNFDT